MCETRNEIPSVMIEGEKNGGSLLWILGLNMAVGGLKALAMAAEIAVNEGIHTKLAPGVSIPPTMGEFK